MLRNITPTSKISSQNVQNIKTEKIFKNSMDFSKVNENIFYLIYKPEKLLNFFLVSESIDKLKKFTKEMKKKLKIKKSFKKSNKCPKNRKWIEKEKCSKKKRKLKK